MLSPIEQTILLTILIALDGCIVLVVLIALQLRDAVWRVLHPRPVRTARPGKGEVGGFRYVSYIRPGMRVVASDGVALGKVREVWCGVDPRRGDGCDERVCSRLEVRHRRRLTGAATVYYIPCGAVAGVSKRRVTLDVPTGVVAEWAAQPPWVMQARAGLARPATAGQGAYEGAASFGDDGGMMG